MLNIIGSRNDDPMLPADVIVNHLLPFLDRTTFDACILLNREVYRLSRHVLPPWPLEGTLQLSKELTCIDASHDAIACGCQTGQVILIWRRTGKRVEFQTAGGMMAAVTVVAFSDDDAQQQQQQQHLAIGRVDGSIQVLHFVQDEENEQPGTMLYHHQSPPTDSNRSVSYITLNGRHTAPIHSLVFYGTDQKYLVSAAMDDESVHFWNTTNGDRIGSIMDYQMGFSAIALSPNQQTLAGIDWDGSLSLYPLAKEYGISKHRMMPPYRSIHPGLAMTTQLQFSKDGKFLFGIRNGYLQRWDCTTGDYSLVSCPNRATTILNPQGDCLARYTKGMLGIEPVEEGQGFSQIMYKKVTEQKWCLAFSQDGRMLIVGGVNGQLQFWSNYEQQFLCKPCPTLTLVLPEMSRDDSTDLTNRLAFGVCNNCVAGSVCLFSKQGLGC